ncbi:LysR family transcriptional regulator (plasmid) [Sinorhizobium meliloti]|uniref:LysR family transcriptional regulator n=1 Tax=Rhizobium meliloti TaxID=382 RepID=UPI000FDA97EC|nr:LysR family transcriptional regulator [Sinorhizobium meliloti]MDX0574238.1 LysR family transcriptional regulator [Sinorhizobium medicae]MCO6425573.1 LysR family transcriptional regulator [Sinorhizobium meliloti]MDX0234353.1 LysR family transcriptional regulator [Sinorhizobium meliloti]MDX0673037.1 LysR family transcriptional regulator [Sinorhizobium medicae]MDX0710333.1 LysR family transcriptional regulator [Sinorhizobium medicae]
MEFRQLKYFVGVAEAGSFTKAAAQLNVAQSALSLHVRQMEEGFGTQLLIRDRTGVTLTSAGSKLLNHARIILDQVSRAEQELTSKVKSPSGEVTIGIPSGAARVMVAELLAIAKERLPRVSLKIVEGMSGPVEEWMAAGRFNIAILYKTVERPGDAEVLASEEFCLVGPPDQPPFEETIRLADLHAYPLAVPMRVNNVRRSVADVVALHGCTLDVRFEVDSLSSIISMVMDGKAYSILTPSAIQREVCLGQIRIVRIVEPAITRTVVLAVNPKDERSVEVNAVRALITEVVHLLAESGKWPTILPEVASASRSRVRASG